MSSASKKSPAPALAIFHPEFTPDAARDILLRMVANFPGLHADYEHLSVDGADLVEWLNAELYAFSDDAELKNYAENGTPS